jgi:hypothetical protein
MFGCWRAVYSKDVSVRRGARTALVAVLLVTHVARAAPPADEEPALHAPAPSASASSPNNAVAWTLLGASAAAVVGASLFGGMALQAKSDFDHTALQRPALDASDRYSRDTAAFATCGAAAVLLAALSVYLLVGSRSGPRASPPASPTVQGVGFGRGGLVVLFWPPTLGVTTSCAPGAIAPSGGTLRERRLRGEFSNPSVLGTHQRGRGHWGGVMSEGLPGPHVLKKARTHVEDLILVAACIAEVAAGATLLFLDVVADGSARHARPLPRVEAVRPRRHE